MASALIFLTTVGMAILLMCVGAPPWACIALGSAIGVGLYFTYLPFIGAWDDEP